ncbi:MAG: PIN domain-containing protein [Planctomycetota bacterium]|nr:MAG: PIN domain-containing protein [Planctomycetota bacterium]
MTKVFLDTNILVYSYDRSDPKKQKKAFKVLDYLALSDRGSISTQILSEFFVTVTKKIPEPLSIQEAIERLENFLKTWEILQITPFIILEAARGVRDYKLSFWDSQIWATAKMNQISVVFSEDFSEGSTIEGVEFINPLSKDFSIEDWG